MRCRACASEVSPGSRFCPACGAAQTLEDAATLDAGAHTPPSGSGRRSETPPTRISSAGTSGAARFPTGTLLAERYRIIAPVGKGGMGEVYRAEDLKLDQQVALKFLPETLAQDGAALARFHREVRLARQVSHPNVCRVFDIGEAEGQPFLTMEYVDGEDLKSLLRRIGRLPPDKAVDIARQLCAGLAAAHEYGVLHRDLKPANIMLDARGKVRVTDFGLAAVADETHREEVRAGTPAYMAPEQMAGKEVTVRSDIYALGLVLYEVFTGKHAFEAGAVVSFKELEQSTPTNPSQLVKDMDPLVERVILRCLEHDPRKRPASALQVAAALPGGDPLAAALAAGETPSPEMVAAAGETEGLRPAVAWALLAAVALGVVASVLLSAQAKLYRRVPLEKPPEALAERANDILQSAGYPERPVDTAMGFTEGGEFLRYIAEHDPSKTRWDNLETGAFAFWYRSSPRPLGPRFFISDSPIGGTVWMDDPPLDVSGMALVQLTPRGHLTKFLVVPPQVEVAASNAVTVDWAPLFAAAGFDPKEWTPAQPEWTPPVYSDTRAAWTGSIAERPNMPMRVEAAAYRGKPVYFELIGPWTRPERMQPYKPTRGEQVGAVFGILLACTLLVGTLVLARRNFRQGRGDRRGAARIAFFVFACLSVSWLLGGHHVASIYELLLFLMFFMTSTFVATFAATLYIAVEPYVRRRWPATLVSWSRVLAGNLRDPVVGRDLLLGCVLGGIQIVVARAGWYAADWLSSAPPPPFPGPTLEFLGLRGVLPSMTSALPFAIVISLGQLLVLFLLRTLLRREWAAAIAFVALFTVFGTLGPGAAGIGWPALVQQLVISSLAVILILRFGVLPIVAGAVFSAILGNVPLTTQVSAWYAGISLTGLLLAAAMAFYGFYTSLGGNAMFGGATLDD